MGQTRKGSCIDMIVSPTLYTRVINFDVFQPNFETSIE